MIEEVEVPPTSVFVAREYVQHAGIEWHEDLCIRCHSYLIPESHEQPDPIALLYEGSTASRSKKAAVFLQRGLGQKMGDSDGDARIPDGCSR